MWTEATTRATRPSVEDRTDPGTRRGRPAPLIVAFTVAVGAAFLLLEAFDRDPAVVSDPTPGPVGEIAIVSAYDVYVLEASDPSSEPTLLLDRTVDPNETAGLDFTWSPDGSMVAFTDPDPDGAVTLFVANADGSDIRPVTPPELDARSPSWSPDGEQLVFEGFGESGYDLYVVALQDGSIRRLTHMSGDGVDGAFMPAWSPDGRSIAFSLTRYDESTSTEDEVIVVMDAAGGSYRVLSSGPLDESPAWSVNSDEIAFKRKWGPEDVDIFVVGVEPGQERLVAHTTPIGPFSWSPHDRSIAFIDRDSLSLQVSDAEGNIRVLAISAELGDGQPGLPIWSPDGMWIAVSSWSGREDAWITFVSASGGGVETYMRDDLHALAMSWRPSR